MNQATPPVVRNPPAVPLNLRRVAVVQRALILIILAQIVFYVGAIAVPAESDAQLWLALVLLAGVLLSAVAGVVAVIALASATGSGVFGAVIRGIGLFLPLLGLIVLVVTNMRATRILRENGVRVGFLGVSRGEIQRLAS